MTLANLTIETLWAVGFRYPEHQPIRTKKLNVLLSVAGDPTIVALAGLDASAGFLVQTAADTFIKRAVTGTANEIVATNGDGVSGNPTLSLPASLTFTGKTITGGTYASPTDTGTSLFAGMRQAGTSLVRIEGTGNVAPTGATGDGFDLFASAGAAFLQGFNYTSSAFIPLSLRASVINLLPQTGGVDVAGSLTAAGQVTTAGYRDNGSLVARFEGSGIGVPTGSTGLGVEIFQAGGAGQIDAYNRTTAAEGPLNVGGSAVNIQTSGSTRLAASSTGIDVAGAITASGQVTTAGYRDNGSFVARFEGSGGGVPSGSTGVGVEIYQTGGSAYVQFYNRTTSAFAPGVLETGGLKLQIAGSVKLEVVSGGIDVTGEARCDTLRIDASETVAAVVSDRWIAVNINGTVRKLLLAS